MSGITKRLLGIALAGSGALAIVNAQTPAPLVQPQNLVYQGAFRLPAGTFGASSFGYGGTALAYYRAHNSLFMVGNDQQQKVAEVSIPAIRKGTTLSGLDTASVLQPFADPTEGRLPLADPGEPNPIKFGGLLPFAGKLYMTAFAYYDGDKTQRLTHFVSGTSFSVTGDVSGPYQVGTVGASFVSGYFAEIPAAWQSALGGSVANGNCCLSIITRTSYGPALFSLNPADIGSKNPVPASPLVYYPSDHFVNDWDVQSTFFNGATEVRGVVIPDGTRSALFFGRQGLGPFCYGEGAACGDPTDQYKGTHAYPYSYYVWAYDLQELASVKAGQKQPWAVRTYAVWALTLPFAQANAHINGATYDSQTRRIYLTQAFGDGSQPLVHVFTVENAASPTPAPGAPGIVRIIK